MTHYIGHMTYCGEVVATPFKFCELVAADILRWPEGGVWLNKESVMWGLSHDPLERGEELRYHMTH